MEPRKNGADSGMIHTGTVGADRLDAGSLTADTSCFVQLSAKMIIAENAGNGRPPRGMSVPIQPGTDLSVRLSNTASSTWYLFVNGQRVNF